MLQQKKPRLNYNHEIWRLSKKGRPWRKAGIIKTKKMFKAWTVLFFDICETDPPPRIGFRLLESPNKAFYEIHPYTNRLGNDSVLFTKIK